MNEDKNSNNTVSKIGVGHPSVPTPPKEEQLQYAQGIMSGKNLKPEPELEPESKSELEKDLKSKISNPKPNPNNVPFTQSNKKSRKNTSPKKVSKFLIFVGFSAVLVLGVNIISLILLDRAVIDLPIVNLEGVYPKSDDVVINRPEGNIEFINDPNLLPNFKFGTFSDELEGITFLADDNHGNILAGVASESRIYGLEDKDGDGVAENVRIVLEGLDSIGGFFVHCEVLSCYLYVAEQFEISRYEYVPELMNAINKDSLYDIVDGVINPQHSMYSFDYNNEPYMFFSISAPCNSCADTGYLASSVLASPIDEIFPEIFATGLRDVLVMAQDGDTGSIFGLELSRTSSVISAPDEINIIEKDNNYGWPYCYGKNTYDIESLDATKVRASCSEPFESRSVIDIAYGRKPKGIAKVPVGVWPYEFDNSLVVSLDKGLAFIDYTNQRLQGLVANWPMVSSFSQPGVLLVHDGILYIADDVDSRIYTLEYTGTVIPKPQAVEEIISEPIQEAVCNVTGCNSEICSDRMVDSVCIYKPEYMCLEQAICERQEDSYCGWTTDLLYDSCMQDFMDEQ